MKSKIHEISVYMNVIVIETLGPISTAIPDTSGIGHSIEKPVNQIHLVNWLLNAMSKWATKRIALAKYHYLSFLSLQSHVSTFVSL